MVRRGCRGHILNMSSYSPWMPFPGLALQRVEGLPAGRSRWPSRRRSASTGSASRRSARPGVATDLYGLTPAGSGSARASGCLSRPTRCARRGLRALWRAPVIVPDWWNRVWIPPLQDTADVGPASGPQVHHEISEINTSEHEKTINYEHNQNRRLRPRRRAGRSGHRPLHRSLPGLGMDAVADLINPYYPAEMIGRLEHGIISFHEACDECAPPVGHAPR